MRSSLELIIMQKYSSGNDYDELLRGIMYTHHYMEYINESSIGILGDIFEDMYELSIHPNVWWLKNILNNFSMIKRENYLKLSIRRNIIHTIILTWLVKH